ncbi:MAG: alpha,alpha-trehalose-phosphate synthase (UDP-forming) [Actinomycetota bacterium]
MTRRQIIVASNRGPLSFVQDESGNVVPRRGTGGLVTALSGALHLSGGLWIASAMTDEDRKQAAAGRLEVMAGGERHDVRYLAFDPEAYDGFYNGISNRVLWFLHHVLWDIPRAPRFDEATQHAWDGYVEINRGFARALADEGEGSDERAYLVQDYHLSLVPAMLRDLQPGARVAHFSHIPFADPGYLRILPGPIRRALLEGLLGADLLGFQAEAWATNFLRSCQAHTEAAVDVEGRTISWKGRDVRVGVYPISIDVEALRESAAGDEVSRARRAVLRWRGDRKLLLRVDRAELSKNILRGFHAYEEFLRDHPEWRGKVVFLALLNPSRSDIPEYRTYVKDCRQAAERINERFGRKGWAPVRLSVKDDLPMTLAAFGLNDALLVNPVFDGMNLVAKEGPVLNERDGVLILSENTGAYEELGRHALGINPFDVGETAAAIASALEMDASERAWRAAALREAVTANRLDRWVDAQLDDLEEVRAGRAAPAARPGVPRPRRPLPRGRPESPRT